MADDITYKCMSVVRIAMSTGEKGLFELFGFTRAGHPTIYIVNATPVYI
jgi:hypothetical protein